MQRRRVPVANPPGLHDRLLDGVDTVAQGRLELAHHENYHTRRSALPAPGDDDALCQPVGRVMGQRLDRDRPLWEWWVIEGLAEGRWALLLKLHHCLADGVSTAQLYNALFAANADPMAAPGWTDEPPPGPGALVLAVRARPPRRPGSCRAASTGSRC
ncbi:wax ester/triacylglycerol synthase domain-containing protein [Actinophytocola sp.]|uniref:wax ester/triacylglycerol synthase domain-containing protein n=1 Tax=Actinophytocola sp. TaxID=1872138 RepID=UPI0025BE9C9D|nr:wax ester/triacylglycerol synthase domain-containing protein [Actinophytocola sp.]